jgi:TonB family protein
VGTAVERPTNGKSALADDDVPLLDAELDPSASSSGILPVRRPARDDDSDTTIPTRGERAATDKRALARRRKSKLPFVIIGIALLASSALVIAGMNRDKDAPATAQVTNPTPPAPPAPSEPTPPAPTPTPTEVTNPTEGSATEGSATEGSATEPAPTDPPVAEAPVEPPPSEVAPDDSKKPGKKKTRVATADPKTPKAKDPKEPKPAVVPEPREGGCDEVSCVMDKYARACCAKYKPADPGYKPQVKPTGGNGELPGTLDKTMIRTGTAKVKGAIIECGVKANAKGTVKVSVNVGADGRVSSSSVVSSPDAGLGDCVAAAIRKATYARTANGGTFTYPFVF